MTAARPDISVVIPVFNSDPVVKDTVRGVLADLRESQRSHEVILVDDGSTDSSWASLLALAQGPDPVVAIRLLRNFGQHNANLAGLRASRGRWVVTMDDDGQNPPDQIQVLISHAEHAGHDVVFGRFRVKEASRVRFVGSRLVGAMNRRVFHKPPGLVVSNFRAIRRDVVDRICADASRYPYVTGQALLYSSRPGNVDVDHAPRGTGESNYNLRRILALVVRILFSYSVAPLHMLAAFGALVAVGSFLAGAVTLIRGLVADVEVAGWTTIVVLLSFLQGVTLLLLAMLGEYTVRTLTQVSERPTYIVAEMVDDR